MQEQCVIGVDLGGTNVRAAAFSLDGEPLGEKFEAPSRADEGTAATLDAVAAAASDVCGSRSIAAVGLAIPGHIEDSTGFVRWAPNFGEWQNGVFLNWQNVQVREPLEDRLEAPVVMGNDANLAALGEYRFGVGQNSARAFVLFTIGTGIGSGVILRPEAVWGKADGPLMLVGGNGGGAEFGHMVIHSEGLDCNAGSYGAIEAYCQRDSIIARAVHRLKRGRRSCLSGMAHGDLSLVTPLMLFEAAEEGDELAIQVWAEVGTYLGIGLANAINIFAPDVVAVGGQIAKAGEWLLEPARKSARDAAIPSLFADAKIVQAEQIEDAGVLGGAALAIERLKWSNTIQ